VDLFTKRCGCGAIYKPAVATSRACAKCSDTALAAQRAQVTKARAGEKKLTTYDFSQVTVFIGGKKLEGFQDGESISIRPFDSVDSVLDANRYAWEAFRAHQQRGHGSRADIEYRLNVVFAGFPMDSQTMHDANRHLSDLCPPGTRDRVRLRYDHGNRRLVLETRG
jgi:hypothetical protein